MTNDELFLFEKVFAGEGKLVRSLKTGELLLLRPGEEAPERMFPLNTFECAGRWEREWVYLCFDAWIANKPKFSVTPPVPPNCPHLFEAYGRTYFQCEVQGISERFCVNEEDGIDRAIVAAVAEVWWRIEAAVQRKNWSYAKEWEADENGLKWRRWALGVQL